MAGYRISGPLCSTTCEDIDEGTMCLMRTPPPGPIGIGDYYFALLPDSAIYCGSAKKAADDRKNASELDISDQGLSLLKQIETLRLKPYDDQTGKEITVWTVGATIGYGHLIKQTEWNIYKNGISESVANALLKQNLSPFIASVRDSIKVKLKQNEFDALVILSFNIGSPGFKGSSVVKLVNDPNANTSYENLEGAWKAWNKSQGNVMQGLKNRRQCEWKIYSENIYERW